MELLDYFLKFVKIESTSDPNNCNYPSTNSQLNLMKIIKKEMDILGVKGKINSHGNYIALLDGNPQLKRIGLNAHVDTAPDFNGKNVDPQLITNYDGKEILLRATNDTLSPKIFPVLLKHKNKTLITTNGKTLLGADDKAGVAIIFDVVKNYLELNKKDRHPLSILFTCDEEIGEGAKYFDKDEFKADYAFTLDGSGIEEISIENFYAKEITIDFFGNSIHPGDGKGILKNSIFLLNDFLNKIDIHKTPLYSSNKQGYYHPHEIISGVEKSQLKILLRSFKESEIKKYEKEFVTIINNLKKKNGSECVQYSIKEQYKNMYPKVCKYKEIMKKIENAYNKNSQKFKYIPTRGGTDGATFSYKGCPTPNLPTGSYNHHGKYEFAVLEDMQKISNIVLDILKNN